jgi:uncharacterized protein YaeQ
MYRFQLEYSDIDRGVYESLDLRVARHPSEDAERLVVRVLARALAHEEGLEFGRGLSNEADAALWSRTPTGEVGTWIDVGVPAADRLHRASKKTENLLVFTHKSEASLRKAWRTRKIYRAEAILVYRLPEKLVRTLAEGLARKMSWFITVQDGVLSVAVGDVNLEGVVEKTSLHSITSAKD